MDRFDFLFNKSANLLEAAEIEQEKVAALIEEFKQSSDKLDETTSRINRAVRNSLNESAEKAAEVIIKRVLDKLEDVNKEAERAASEYSSVAKLTATKLFSIFALFFTLAGTVFWFLIVKDIPTIREIEQLMVKRDTLREEVQTLKKYGEIKDCNGSVCIRVDDKQKFTDRKDNGKIYYVIYPKSG